VVRQSYREPGGVGQSAASLARKTLDLWRKSQAHVDPDGVYHALRMRECDQGRVVWDDEALLPCIDFTALPVAAVYQGSRVLPVLPTGRLRLTRSPAARPCRKAPFIRTRLSDPAATSRIAVSRNAPSTI
jgi:hypothetical protein